MTGSLPLIFLLDVDNTLFDNDGFAADLSTRLQRDFGTAAREHYWALYARRREQLGYADYLGALQDFRDGREPTQPLLQLSAFLLDYPFAVRLYPRALEAIAHLQSIGQPVVLSDGDLVFQPRKVQRSGIWDAVVGRVLIFLHKQHELESVQRLYPGGHYVMVDDKPWLLDAMKQLMGSRLTTVFVRQGHYARESPPVALSVPPDLTIERIGDLVGLEAGDFHAPQAHILGNQGTS
jgi:FMN phosphatase YigB (HAD superfamily)